MDGTSLMSLAHTILQMPCSVGLGPWSLHHLVFLVLGLEANAEERLIV